MWCVDSEYQYEPYHVELEHKYIYIYTHYFSIQQNFQLSFEIWQSYTGFYAPG